MNRSRVLLALSLFAAATFGLLLGPRLLLSLQASGLPDLISLAPADSTVIFYADLAQLRSSPLIQKMEASAPSPTTDRDYADFVAATGFDFQRDLDRIVMAVRPEPMKESVVFVEGRFDRQKITQYALRSGKTEKYKGRDIYIVPSTTPGKDIYITFLEGNRLAMADGGDRSSSLAALTASAPAKFDPALQERISRVSGAPIFAVAKAPTTAAGASAGALANSSTPFQLLRWVSMAARPDGEQVIFSLEGECDTPEQAQKVASSLEFLRAILSGGLSDSKTRGQMSEQGAASVSRLLKAAKVTSDASRVRLVVDITPDMISSPVAKASLPAAH